MAARRRRAGLDPDTEAEVALHARMSVHAMLIANGRADEATALAELVAIVPGRPDIVDRVSVLVDRAEEMGRDWPPVAVCRRLLELVRDAVDA